MSAEPGVEAEQFAAAVELRRSVGSPDDELARDLEVVEMLRSRGRDVGPDLAVKARARAALTASLASSVHDHPTPPPGVLVGPESRASGIPAHA